MKKFRFTDERGDTNIVSILIVLTVIVVLGFLFKPYIAELIQSIASFFA